VNSLYYNAFALNNSVKSTAFTNFYAAGNMFTSYYGSQNPPIIYGYMGAGNMSLTYVGAFGQPMIWEGLQNGSTTFTYGNGTDYGTTTVQNATYTYNAYWLGGPSTVPPWPGFLGEVIVYNRTISTTERQQLEGYLAWKWGTVAGLPATHPYKGAAPFGVQLSSRVRFVNTPVFTPLLVSGCQLWLDAADPATVVLSGTNVTQWNDKSGNGRNAVNQNTAGIRVNNVVNGLSVLRLAGVNNYLITYPSFPNSAYTVFTIQYLSSSSGSYARLLQSENSPAGAAPGLFIGVGPNGTSVATFTGPGTGWNDIDANSPAITNLTTWRIVTTWVSGSTLTPYVDGSAQTNKVGSTRAFSNLNIGSYPDTTPLQGWIGDVGEIVIYNSALSTQQRQQVEGYLAWKWGLTASLPTGHPYKTPPIAPFTFGIVRTIVQQKWLPTQIPGCQFWFDAADTSTITSSGSTVSAWSNKGTTTGSNISVLQGTPSTGTVRQNALNTIALPVGTGLRFTASFPTQVRTRFFATRPTVNTSTTTLILLQQNTASTSGFDTCGIFSSTLLEVAQGNVVTIQTGTLPNYQNTFQIFTLRNASTTVQNRIAITGTAQTLATNLVAQQYNTTSQTNHINSSGANDSAMDLGEVLSFNSELTDDQVFQVEGYLAWKWGVQGSLPANHPFRFFPPSP
jgi:hypothetical protein